MNRSERDAAIAAFVAEAGWGDAEIGPLAGDASTRRYLRLTRGAETAVVMDAPPGAEAPACPPDAGLQARKDLGYNALARLAGPRGAAYAGLADYLEKQGLSAPHIHAADLTRGLMLLEDLGDKLFARQMAQGADERELYHAAADALAMVHDRKPPDAVEYQGETWPLLTYDDIAAIAEADLLFDWYLPWQGAKLDAEARRGWEAAWREVLAEAPGGSVLTLRDYHAENLLWLDDRQGAARVGLLDFQDALIGHPAYDLVSLAEDARRDVSPAMQADIMDRYCSAAGIADRKSFESAYAIWGAQRNAKILGIFVRLTQRDGKPRYLDFLPRVEAYFRRDMAHEALTPVRQWMERHARELIA
ncbi:MAG: phosphotransferase [Euryhalocaulis sp.]|uniref:aminoglycoside phosphotransferase family protein n=1 Tax=Euryhalocaulis sp. TaxID=2744307 RepID=UPI0017AB8EDF|nr:phosphotransferase [Euryhalocaulis sp.]MBA4802753.1 phosphotransferase [Euryhalocaulis sp.]